MAFNRGNCICRLLDYVDMSKQLDEIVSLIEEMINEVERANKLMMLKVHTELLESVDKSVVH